MSAFKIEDVTKSFPNGEIEEKVLKGVSLALQEGEITALVGPSGSGKSTILTIAAGLQKASGGQILFDGKDLTTMSQEDIRKIRSSEFGFVFQASHLVPFLTVEEQLELMLDVSETKMERKQQKEEIVNILKLVGMEHRKDAYPPSLSGGEKQRVAIARAIIHKPKILFADEPTASLDTKRKKEVMELIKQLTTSLGLTTLMVTHDDEMLPYANRIITMRDGKIE
ncbi:ABC transporter ATP-binding protein [Sporosarcina saromensis]|uniref:ABC transporter ATP-binding protein n=1 Tax=Sporosarcina saromensis TaxID=359365 RepID=A0ABU4GDM5_9BACL|nr:ABC transporter ATP-binding protein [Sporosarcina saromensis]MDW0114482.1 ABC transporter ATP-binding protein [Sporosarcina saromensis]